MNRPIDDRPQPPARPRRVHRAVPKDEGHIAHPAGGSGSVPRDRCRSARSCFPTASAAARPEDWIGDRPGSSRPVANPIERSDSGAMAGHHARFKPTCIPSAKGVANPSDRPARRKAHQYPIVSACPTTSCSTKAYQAMRRGGIRSKGNGPVARSAAVDGYRSQPPMVIAVRPSARLRDEQGRSRTVLIRHARAGRGSRPPAHNGAWSPDGREYPDRSAGRSTAHWSRRRQFANRCLKAGAISAGGRGLARIRCSTYLPTRIDPRSPAERCCTQA